MSQPIALTIAGSDPSGGAGIQADLKTFHQHGVYGTSVITLLTVQNTQSVLSVQVLEPSFVLAELDTVLSDITPGAVKTGALGNSQVIKALAARLKDSSFPIIIDPVIVSKHGLPLLEEDAIDALKLQLLPLAHLVTPNIAEAELLSGLKITNVKSMEEAALRIVEFKVKNVLIKGGHLSDEAIDVLLTEKSFQYFPSLRINTKNTHGTGCVYSAAITAWLAKGESISEAIRKAKLFVTEAIKTNPEIGKGFGPVNMFAKVSS